MADSSGKVYGRRFSRRTWRRLIVAVLGAGFIGWALFGCNRNEERIVAELDRLSQGAEPTPYLAAFDYICISGDPVGSRWEFAEVAARKSLPMRTACSIWNSSCCNLPSELGGVVGLVEAGALRCVQLRRTAVVPEPWRSFCAKPSELVVKRETVTQPGQGVPASWIPRVGENYYRVGEKSQ
jgi:hypothetical protein